MALTRAAAATAALTPIRECGGNFDPLTTTALDVLVELLLIFPCVDTVSNLVPKREGRLGLSTTLPLLLVVLLLVVVGRSVVAFDRPRPPLLVLLNKWALFELRPANACTAPPSLPLGFVPVLVPMAGVLLALHIVP